MKPIKLYTDLSIHLYEGEAAKKRGAPTPITYLTQWEIVGNSEVHTLPYPDGVVLPNGYKRCEYLESDGTAYIELPFGFDVTDEMYGKVKFNAEYIGERHIISLKNWSTDKDKPSRFCFAGYISGSISKFGVSLGSISSPESNFTPDIPFNLSVCEVSYSNKQYTLSNNDNTSVCNLSNAVFGSESTHICLLKNFSTEGTRGAIYEYRHKKGNTEYHLIPCLDSNDTPCMYDVINNQAYYNSAGSGSFTYKLYPQPTEIWSCGEYNATDGKYHILVQPLGGSIADIALDEPLRKVNDVADTIEFPSETEGKALVTRNIAELSLAGNVLSCRNTNREDEWRWNLRGSAKGVNYQTIGNIICSNYNSITSLQTFARNTGIGIELDGGIVLFDKTYNQQTDKEALEAANANTKYIFELTTPTTELVDAPQIAEADSYTMVISQGAKAVSWSSFETE